LERSIHWDPQVVSEPVENSEVLPPKAAEEILARERERKARTTLFMAIPEDHLAKFHKMTDAKEIWEAIKSKFGRNNESKKMQKYLLKQQFESFSVDEFDLEEMDLKWQMAMISTRLRKFYKKTWRKLHFDAKEPVGFDKSKDEHKAMVTIDGEGVDWTGHAEDKTKDYALMGFNFGNSGSDTEVTSCSKVCEESYAKL
nr:xylulose kinase-1 [Tanacetum cinerariifolium]GEZ91319.1 xylulose kinase-1 [Tanacetum cinerariifolium]